MLAEDIKAVYRNIGYSVRFMDGWEQPHLSYGKEYLWRTGRPELAMWHHTGNKSGSYTPNRLKANAWAGLWDNGKLYQSGPGEPTIVIANLHPALISSGYGVKATIDLVSKDQEVDWKQALPDDRGSDGKKNYAANRSAWNTEVVLDGTGARIDPRVWDMITSVGARLSDRMNWGYQRHIGHGQFTKRKIDLRDGTFANMVETMIEFRKIVARKMEANMITHYQVGGRYKEYEPVTWFLFQILGGDIDANANSAQVQSLLGKTDVRLVTDSDFELIGELVSMFPDKIDKMKAQGLYRFGKEIAALEQQAYAATA